MKIKPINDKVLIEVSEADEVTDGGIILPDDAKEQKDEGIVVAVSDCVEDVVVGDRVLYGKYSGDDLEHGGKKYKLVSFDELLAVIEG